jgi:hypothetical protein
MQTWSGDDWNEYVATRRLEIQTSDNPGATATADGQHPNGSPIRQFDESVLAAVAELVPVPPWPSGMHKEIAAKLGLTNAQASKYVSETIRRREQESTTSPPADDAG